MPLELWEFLASTNGLVAFRGGLHLRGWCDEPDWHSLERYWTGEAAISRRWRSVRAGDVPFGQDCMGDQYLLRDGAVHRLIGETGEVESRDQGVTAFLDEVCADPSGLLSLAPLQRYEIDSGPLEPGRLLMALPPFCAAAAGSTISIRSVPVDDAHGYLSQLASVVQDLPDGASISVRLRDEGVVIQEERN